ncbi:MAG: calcium/sodium antiporter [Henriciella sp.]|nr:calcium/sodium antiporter [Henriciella sp.]
MSDFSLFAALIGGLVILAFAGDFLVNGAVSLSRKMGVSPLVAGILIVGFGTSAPEMVVTLGAALEGSPALALGNVVGSNIANVWLVLAIPALIAPIATGGFGQSRALLFVLLATSAWIIVTAIMPLSPIIGIAFLAALVLYGIFTVTQTLSAARKGIDVGIENEEPTLAGFKLWACLAVGIIGLPIGAHLIVEGGVGIARKFDISEEMIGLTLLAIGTSLPELGAGIAAALRKKSDVVIGNVLGSNVFNLLGAGGLVSLFGPVPIAQGFANYDHWALAATALTLALFIVPKTRISRLAAVSMMLIYGVYLFGLINGWNLLAGARSLVG